MVRRRTARRIAPPLAPAHELLLPRSECVPPPKGVFPTYSLVRKEAAGELAEKNRITRETATGGNSQHAEYNRLRKQLYELQQAAKATEVKVNCAVDDEKHWEGNIEDLLKRKKVAVAENRLGDERFCERLIEKAEGP